MGTYMKIAVERKYENRWVNCDHWRVNPDFPGEGEREMIPIPVYQTQCYELFARLANVRNNSRVPCMGFDRGMPADVSAQTLAEYKSRDYFHTPGYATLAELKQKAGEITDEDAHFIMGRRCIDGLIAAVEERKREIFGPSLCEFKNDSLIRVAFWFD